MVQVIEFILSPEVGKGIKEPQSTTLMVDFF